jgi:hypothetical protein
VDVELDDIVRLAGEPAAATRPGALDDRATTLPRPCAAVRRRHGGQGRMSGQFLVSRRLPVAL